MPEVDSGAFVRGKAGGAAGIAPGTDWAVGRFGCDATASGTPGTDMPGTRGKENISFCAGKFGAAAQGSVLPASTESPVGGVGTPGATADDDTGTAARSAPLGGAVGGDEGIGGTPGKEYISPAGGNCGAA